jgi:hypothetical protein
LEDAIVFLNLKPVTRDTDLPFSQWMRMIGSALLEIISGKFAALLGVLVPPWTASVMPFVFGMETVELHAAVPVHVSSTVSPSAAEAMAALTAAAEQSAGPTLLVAA